MKLGVKVINILIICNVHVETWVGMVTLIKPFSSHFIFCQSASVASQRQQYLEAIQAKYYCRLPFHANQTSSD